MLTRAKASADTFDLTICNLGSCGTVGTVTVTSDAGSIDVSVTSSDPSKWAFGSGNNSDLFAFNGAIAGDPALTAASADSTPITVTPTPEPATLMLLGTGLAVVAMGLRRKKRQ
jgi:hypothetical protein